MCRDFISSSVLRTNQLDSIKWQPPGVFHGSRWNGIGHFLLNINRIEVIPPDLLQYTNQFLSQFRWEVRLP